MQQYIKLSVYREKAYPQGGAPDARTLRRRIDNGDLPGKREGKRYYVLVDKRTGLELRRPETVKPVNSLAAKVLAKALN